MRMTHFSNKGREIAQNANDAMLKKFATLFQYFTNVIASPLVKSIPCLFITNQHWVWLSFICPLFFPNCCNVKGPWKRAAAVVYLIFRIVMNESNGIITLKNEPCHREQNTNWWNVFTLSFETRFMQNHSVNMPNAYLYIWYVLSQKYVVLIPISDRIAKLCSETWARKIESLSSYEFRRGLTCFTINETPYWLAISIPYLQLCWLVGPLKKERKRFA